MRVVEIYYFFRGGVLKEGGGFFVDIKRVKMNYIYTTQWRDLDGTIRVKTHYVDNLDFQRYLEESNSEEDD